MKNLQKKINRQLKIEKFFVEQLWQLCLVTAFIFFCAWIFNKYTEAVLFCISHLVIRGECLDTFDCTDEIVDEYWVIY